MVTGKEYRDHLTATQVRTVPHPPKRMVDEQTGVVHSIATAARAGIYPSPRIVSMVEFDGRLWVATETGVFVKRAGEDVFDPVPMMPMPPTAAVDGRAADEAAGLRPLPEKKQPTPVPFETHKWGEHGP